MTASELSIFSPVDGQLIASYSPTTDEQIAGQMEQARQAAELWQRQTVSQRLAVLSQLTPLILDRMEAIVAVIHQVTGKVKTDILLSEIYPILDMLHYYQQQGESILKPQAVYTSSLVYPAAEAGFSYHPYGIVAVISPWNFPFQLTLYPLLTALIAGNAVVFKLSELSVPIGLCIVDLLAELKLPKGLVQQIIGDKQQAQQLIAQRPDLIFFTGGGAAGKAVMKAAAEHPVPVILELGGKDAMVVFADADIERALNAVLYGAFVNSGQVCVSVETLYIEEALYYTFLLRLCSAVEQLKMDQDFGPISSPHQCQVIQALYEDAIAKGAKASCELSFDGQYSHPLVLWDVTEKMRLMQEEVFGPLLAVCPFSDAESLIEQINRNPLGLNASVWSKQVEKARIFAQRLEVGNWAVNDVLKNIGHSGLPFGGVKGSGFGRYHGVEGLRSFCYTVSGLVSQSALGHEPNWFPYSEPRYRMLAAFVHFRFSTQSIVKRLRNHGKELLAFRQYAEFNFQQYWKNLKIRLSGRF